MAEYADPMTPAHGDPNQAILLELALLMNERRSVAEVFASFAERLLAATRFEFTSLVTVEPDPRYARVVGRYPVWDGSLSDGTVMKLSEAPAEWLESGIEGVEYRPQADDAGIWHRYHERGLRDCWVSNLRLEGTSHGFLTVARRAVTRISTGELDFLRAASRLLAAAVRQDRLLVQAEQEAAQSQLSNELAVLVHADEPIEALFDRMLAIIEQAISLDHISFTLRADADNYVLIGARPAAGLPVGVPTSAPQAQDDVVFEAPGCMVEYRTDRTEGYWPGLLGAAGIMRVMSGGLRAGDDRLGFISIGRASNFAFSDGDRRFIAQLAVMLSQAEANRRRLEQIAEAAARERVLNELSRLLNAGGPVDRLFADFPRLLEPAIDCDYVGLVVPTETSGIVQVVGAHPELVWPAGTTMTRAEADLERAAPARGVVQAETRSVPDSPPCAVLHANGILRIAVATRFEDDQPAGRLTIGRKRDTPYSAEDVEFIEVLSTLLGQAVVNQQRLQRIEMEAVRAGILNELATLLNAGERIDALFDRLLPPLEQAIEFDFVELSVADDQPGMLRQVGSRPELLRGRGATVDFDTVGMKPVAELPGVVQYRSDRVPGEPDAILSREGIIRVAAIALRDGPEPVGMLAIARRRNMPYTPQDAEFIESVSTIFSQAVSNQRRLQRIETEAARARVLNELTILLNAGEPVDALFDRLLVLLERAIEFDYVGLLALADRPGFLRMVGSRPELVRPVGDEVDMETAGLLRLAAQPGVSQYRTRLEPSVSSKRLAETGIERGASAVLRAAGEPVGMFAFGRRREARYTAAEEEFIEVLATILGQAVGNQRRLEAARGEAARNRLLAEMAVLLNAGEPPRRFFDRLSELLQAAVSFDYMALLVAEAGGQQLRVEGSLRSLVLKAGAVLPADQVLAGPPVTDGRLVHQHLTGEIGSTVADVSHHAGVARVASAVLLDGDDLLGVFLLGRESETPFEPDELELLELLATLLGQAMANEQRLRRTRAEAARNKLLSELAILLNAGEPVETVFHAVAESLRQIVPWDRAALLTTNRARTALRWACTIPGDVVPAGEELPMSPMVEGLLGQPSARVRVSNLPIARADRAAAVGGDWLLAAPLRQGGLLLGGLVLVRDTDQPFTDEETRFVEFLATLLTHAVANQARIESAASEAEEQRVVAAVAAAAAAESNPGALVGAIIEPLRQLIPRPFLAFGYLDGDYVVYPVPNGPDIRSRLERYQEMAIQEGQIHARSLPDDVAPSSPLRAFGVKANATTLARSGGEPMGILLTGSRQEGYTFGRRELRIFRLIAQILGPAMENARAAERQRREAQEQRILAEVAAVAAREKEVPAILAGIAGPLGQTVSRPLITYGHLGPGDTVSWTGRKEAPPRPLLPLEKKARDDGQMVHSASDLDHGHPPEPTVEQLGIHQFTITPIQSGGSVIALLAVTSRDPDYRFSGPDLSLLQRVASIVGPGIEAARAAASIAQQRALYDLILRSLTEGVIMLDSDTHVVFANAPGRALVEAIDPDGKSQPARRRCGAASRQPRRGVDASHHQRRGHEWPGPIRYRRRRALAGLRTRQPTGSALQASGGDERRDRRGLARRRRRTAPPPDGTGGAPCRPGRADRRRGP